MKKKGTKFRPYTAKPLGDWKMFDNPTDNHTDIEVPLYDKLRFHEAKNKNINAPHYLRPLWGELPMADGRSILLTKRYWFANHTHDIVPSWTNKWLPTCHWCSSDMPTGTTTWSTPVFCCAWYQKTLPTAFSTIPRVSFRYTTCYIWQVAAEKYPSHGAFVPLSMFSMTLNQIDVHVLSF